MTVTIKGPQGSGKTSLLRTLEEAGWFVGSETVLDDNNISVVVEMPKKASKKS